MLPFSPSAALPGVIRQVGYVEPDLDKAIESWVAIGIGPWFVIRNQAQPTIYRGEASTVTVSIAFANSGDMQLELIQQLDDSPSPHRDFLASGRSGYNQFAWWAEDYDAVLKAAESGPWPIVWQGGDAGSTRFHYLEAPAGSPVTMYEIMELTDGTRMMGDMVRAAAANWDGTDPVRELGAS